MSKLPRRILNLAQELRSGQHFGVFIDDTGSPGLNTPGLHSKRKSWVAVIVSPTQIVEVLDQLPRALSFLHGIGVTDPEFHFTDIWAGKNAFARLDLQARLGMFRFMAWIFENYKFPVLVQTLDPHNAAAIQDRPNWPQRFGPLKLSRHEDLALVLLLMRVRDYVRTVASDAATACVIVDEGRLPKGSNIALPGLAPLFHGGAVLFADSRTALPLQLADFAAFSMNRWPLLRVKSNLSELDKSLLEILSPIGPCFVNIELAPIQGLAQISSLSQGMH